MNFTRVSADYHFIVSFMVHSTVDGFAVKGWIYEEFKLDVYLDRKNSIVIVNMFSQPLGDNYYNYPEGVLRYSYDCLDCTFEAIQKSLENIMREYVLTLPKNKGVHTIKEFTLNKCDVYPEKIP